MRRVATVAHRRLTPEQRTEELLAAAEEIVIESGVESLTLEQCGEGQLLGTSRTPTSRTRSICCPKPVDAEQGASCLVIERVPRPSSIGEWLRAWVAVVLDEGGPAGTPADAGRQHRDEMQRRHTRDLLLEALTERLETTWATTMPSPSYARILIRAMKGAILALVVDGVPVEAVEAELEEALRLLVVRSRGERHGEAGRRERRRTTPGQPAHGIHKIALDPSTGLLSNSVVGSEYNKVLGCNKVLSATRFWAQQDCWGVGHRWIRRGSQPREAEPPLDPGAACSPLHSPRRRSGARVRTLPGTPDLRSPRTGRPAPTHRTSCSCCSTTSTRQPPLLRPDTRHQEALVADTGRSFTESFPTPICCRPGHRSSPASTATTPA